MGSCVLVTGGTGNVGRGVVGRLMERGHRVRVLSRAPHGLSRGVTGYSGDVATGIGLIDAVAGAEVIVHLASEPLDPERVDLEGTRRLLGVARDRGHPHFVYVSIVGIDGSTARYYRAKRAAEELIAGSGLPWTVLRATQFHTLVVHLLKGLGADEANPVVVPAGVRFQPLDPDDVAARLAEIAESTPNGRVPDIGGPEVRRIEDLAVSYLRAVQRRATVEPGGVGGEYRDYFDVWRSGANLCPNNPIGTVTWEAYLHRSIGAGAETPAPR